MSRAECRGRSVAGGGSRVSREECGGRSVEGVSREECGGKSVEGVSREECGGSVAGGVSREAHDSRNAPRVSDEPRSVEGVLWPRPCRDHVAEATRLPRRGGGRRPHKEEEGRTRRRKAAQGGRRAHKEEEGAQGGGRAHKPSFCHRRRRTLLVRSRAETWAGPAGSTAFTSASIVPFPGRSCCALGVCR